MARDGESSDSSSSEGHENFEIVGLRTYKNRNPTFADTDCLSDPGIIPDTIPDFTDSETLLNRHKIPADFVFTVDTCYIKGEVSAVGRDMLMLSPTDPKYRPKYMLVEKEPFLEMHDKDGSIYRRYQKRFIGQGDVI